LGYQRVQNVFVPSSFVNTRCTFQRARDAKIFHCWVESFDEREIAARFAGEGITEREKFYFQVYGIDQDVRFSATLHTRLNNSFGFGDADHSGSVLGMFTICSEFKISASQGGARLANQGMSAFFTVDGILVSDEPIDIVDVSKTGISAVLPLSMKKDQQVVARVMTINGEVEMKVVVRNFRAAPAGGTRYGFEILEMHRIDRLRWAQVFSSQF
jgi:hypothetical protein